jgi:hypothetical protein
MYFIFARKPCLTDPVFSNRPPPHLSTSSACCSQTVYACSEEAAFVTHRGLVTQEDGTEQEELINEAKNMSIALCQKVS